MYEKSLSKGYSCLQQGDFNGAFNIFRKTYKHATDEETRKTSLIGISLVHKSCGYLNKSIDITVKLSMDYPNDGLIHYNLGNMYLESGQNALAIQSYDRAIDTYGPNADFHINRAIAWFRSGNQRMAINDLQNALEMDPLNETALINIGMLHLNSGKYESAIDLFDIVLENNDKNLRALLGKGLSLFHLDMYDESMICLDAALSIDMSFYIAHFYKGRILHKLDLFDEASESLKKAITINNRHVPSHYELGQILLEMGQQEQSISSFRSVIVTKGPLSKDALVQIGKIYLYERKEPKKALTYFKKAINIDPEDGEVWAHSGIAFRRDDHPIERAMLALEKAIKLGWSDLGSGLELSSIYIEAKEQKKARELLEFLTDRYQDPGSYLMKANVEFSMDLFKECIDSSESSLRLDPDNMEPYLLMGRCYGRMGRMEEYKQCLKKYLHTRPNDDNIVRELSSIET
ncbi:MAG: tetratricopeptide repeat protein [Candidatus Thermoplasmatota archaeon]|nr:tetratricopeptide repeat protein [Candidatus Thermoplasmatota archaeon]